MWVIKTFKTKNSMLNFIERNKNKIQWEEIYLNNIPYAIEYRKLKVIKI